VSNTNALERLAGQVDAVLTALHEARADNARLNEELAACQAHGRELEGRIGDLEEQLGFKDMELEDLATRIEAALGAPQAHAEPVAEAAEA
jgi:predicted nuclease with TOPRIM domain